MRIRLTINSLNYCDSIDIYVDGIISNWIFLVFLSCTIILLVNVHTWMTRMNLNLVAVRIKRDGFMMVLKSFWCIYIEVLNCYWWMASKLLFLMIVITRTINGNLYHFLGFIWLLWIKLGNNFTCIRILSLTHLLLWLYKIYMWATKFIWDPHDLVGSMWILTNQKVY